MAVTKLKCNLCGLELNHHLLIKDFTESNRAGWFQCFKCRLLQKLPSRAIRKKHFKKKIALYIHSLWVKRQTNIKLPKPFFTKTIPQCFSCNSTDLLQWDGKCPRCGSELRLAS